MRLFLACTSAHACDSRRYEKERIKREFKDARLKGAVVQTHDEGKIERMLQRKTANSIKSTPAVDALTRTARRGFFKEGAKAGAETVEDRVQNRRKAIDASLLAPTRLLQLQNTATTLRSLVEEDDDDDEDDGEEEDDGDGEGHFDESSDLLKFRPPFKKPDFIQWIEATGHWRDYQESDHKRYNYNGDEVARDRDKDIAEMKRKEAAEIKDSIANSKPLKAYLHLYVRHATHMNRAHVHQCDLAGIRGGSGGLPPKTSLRPAYPADGRFYLVFASLAHKPGRHQCERALGAACEGFYGRGVSLRQPPSKSPLLPQKDALARLSLSESASAAAGHVFCGGSGLLR
jgi:hypothetical protein